MESLREIDSLDVVVLVDNELDVMSPPPPDTVQSNGTTNGQICCSAHGLSVLVTAIKGEERRTMLFDTGPEEDIWARNVGRLRPDLVSVERIQLSHWHCDHSGGMLRAIRLINEAKQKSSNVTPALKEPVVVDVHPSRPDYRGVRIESKIISLEADPTLKEIEEAGARLETNDKPHTVLDGMFLVSGEIPRVTEYETGLKHAIRFNKSTGQRTEDEFIRDERFLGCKLKGAADKGIVVVTGCSHAGVVNTTKHAIKLIGKPVYAVFGGYHLAASDIGYVQATVRDLKRLDPKILRRDTALAGG
ncbi:hypothetical protein VTO42DRAFT_7248 [Malbranchea cinnamomea]